MAKCIQTLDDVVYTIGGAKDQRTRQTISDVIASQYNPQASQVI
jgi:Kelch motif